MKFIDIFFKSLFISIAFAENIDIQKCFNACQNEINRQSSNQCASWKKKLPRPSLGEACFQGYSGASSKLCYDTCDSASINWKSEMKSACQMYPKGFSKDFNQACNSGFKEAMKLIQEEVSKMIDPRRIGKNEKHRQETFTDNLKKDKSDNFSEEDKKQSKMEQIVIDEKINNMVNEDSTEFTEKQTMNNKIDQNSRKQRIKRDQNSIEEEINKTEPSGKKKQENKNKKEDNSHINGNVSQEVLTAKPISNDENLNKEVNQMKHNNDISTDQIEKSRKLAHKAYKEEQEL